jgi:hypothetical protein
MRARERIPVAFGIEFLVGAVALNRPGLVALKDTGRWGNGPYP